MLEAVDLGAFGRLGHEACSSYLRTLGEPVGDCVEIYNRLPSAVELPQAAVSPQCVRGYLLSAWERKKSGTGLLFCDQSQGRPNGSPIQTGIIGDRAWVGDTNSSSLQTGST